MHCFYHQQTAAVGMCKHCSKGICPDCAVDTGYGLACKGACETEVKTIHEIISLNKRVARNAKTSYARSSLFVLFAGIIFVILGAVMAGASIIGYIFIVLGLGFIGFAAFISSLGKKITQQEQRQ